MDFTKATVILISSEERDETRRCARKSPTLMGEKALTDVQTWRETVAGNRSPRPLDNLCLGS